MVDIEPKDYLFQSIIDIVNNPDVKSIFGQYNNDLFKFDIDRNVYRRILYRNPRLIFSLLSTKPFINYELLDKCYNQGFEITNILGEDKTIEILESLEINNLEMFEKLNNKITKYIDLPNKIKNLIKMNEDNVIICSILFLIFIPGMIGVEIFGYIYNLNPKGTIWSIVFSPPLLLFCTIAIISLLFLGKFDCFPDPYFS